ncbi:MAG: methyltransferase [Xanthobacteraceae bacterium]|jgi:tRNA1(Val) A37 N6-methylase TrmN6
MSSELSAERGELSEDAVLDGRLVLRQPRRGHRFGHDAILLAAATPARAGERAADLGAGVGAAGLALARRVDGVAVTLIERDPMLSELGRENAERNGFAVRVRAFCLDVAAPAAAFAAAGLAPESLDHVLMNPPFNAPHNPSPDPGRSAAHTASDDTLAQWLDTAARLLHPAGTVTLIWRADGLGAVLDALGAGFGAIAVMPIHPKPGAAAIRVLVRAIKARSGPLVLLPGLVLADTDGRPTREAEAVLRANESLPWAAPAAAGSR